MDDIAGREQLGTYTLLTRIASGTIAETFLARPSAGRGFDRPVALKRMHPQFAEDPAFVERLVADARAVATLDHPNVARIHDCGVQDDVCYYASEYLQGRDLASLLQILARHSRRLPLEHALAIVLGAAAGLDHAHEQCGPDGLPRDIVHCDVSPANIFVLHDGGVKVVDFGLASAVYHGACSADPGLQGRAAYWSPEQCRGEAIDRRSDIYALGIVLWELTLERPLPGNLRGDPARLDPRTLRRQYPPELARIVLRALEQDPACRYPSARALQLDLEAFAREHKLAVGAARLGEFMQGLFDTLRERVDLQRLLVATDPGLDLGPAAPPSLADVLEPEAPRHVAKPPRRGLLAPLAAAGIVVMAATFAMLWPGEPTPLTIAVAHPPEPMHPPEPAPTVLRLAAATPATMEIVVAGPELPTPPPPRKPLRKKTGKKTRTTLLKGWDPDSALPP